jgi:hypothetical protein
MLYDPLNDYNEVGQTLVKSARYIEEHGHAQSKLWCNGRVCVLGALSAIIYGHTTHDIYSDDNDLAHKCKEALKDALNSINFKAYYKSRPVSVFQITDFNDSHSKKEVVDMIYKAAEKHKVIS